MISQRFSTDFEGNIFPRTLSTCPGVLLIDRVRACMYIRVQTETTRRKRISTIGVCVEALSLAGQNYDFSWAPKRSVSRNFSGFRRVRLKNHRKYTWKMYAEKDNGDREREGACSNSASRGNCGCS